MTKRKINDIIESTNDFGKNVKQMRANKTKRQKIVTGFTSAVAFILVFGCGLLIGADAYIESKLNRIEYDDGTQEWSGVDIDDPQYDLDNNGGVPLLPDDFVDPEADDTVPVQKPSDNSGAQNPKPDIENQTDEVINILLIGADTLTGVGRSDTMILMSINKTDKRIVLTSLMRDMWVSIPGHKNNRLNASHSAGGPTLLMETIYANFGIKVDKYVKVDFSSFKKAVDIIGGIDLTVNENNYDYFSRYYSGVSVGSVVHLDGAEALKYSRNRQFKQGDFIRTLHQRDMLTQFAKQLAQKSLQEIDKVLNTVLDYVVTNIPKQELKDYIGDAITYLGYNMDTARLPCAGSFKNADKNGRAVLEVDFDMNILYLKTKIYG